MSIAWVQPGAQVVEVGSNRAFGKIHTIAKVHKNGNFTVNGSTQQFKPWNDGSALQTGDSWVGRKTLRYVDDATFAKIAEYRRFVAALNVINVEINRLAALRNVNMNSEPAFVAKLFEAAAEINARKGIE